MAKIDNWWTHPNAALRTLETDGRCYELSLRWLIEGGPGQLVHGSVWGGVGIGRLDHAWIEDGDDVIDLVFKERWQRDDYANSRGAEVHRKYSLVEAADMCNEFGTYGPWVQPPSV